MNKNEAIQTARKNVHLRANVRDGTWEVHTPRAMYVNQTYALARRTASAEIVYLALSYLGIPTLYAHTAAKKSRGEVRVRVGRILREYKKQHVL